MQVRSRHYIAAVALVALAIGVGYGLMRDTRVFRMFEPPPPDAFVFGVYDPGQQFSNAGNIAIEHLFVPWQKNPAELRRTLQQAKSRDRQLLVTVEPWTDAPNRVNGAHELFDKIAAGDYDSRIRAVCREFAKARSPVLVRWGHEMEDVTGRYPWARSDADAFKHAFRQFVDVCRSVAPSSQFVWSPKGESNLGQYYPGDAYVDYVGLSVFTLQSWDLDRYGAQRTFRDVVAEKYQRVERYRKPVVIAEFAIYGDKAYKDQFFSNFRQSLPEFPWLVALVYFNDKEPHFWPEGYGSPDWRVMNEHFFQLTATGLHS